jgi:hypothetical protein
LPIDKSGCFLYNMKVIFTFHSVIECFFPLDCWWQSAELVLMT